MVRFRCGQLLHHTTGRFFPVLNLRLGYDTLFCQAFNGRIMEAQRIQGQIRRGDVSYLDTKKAGELLGRSGLQLPRVPSLNTDRKNSRQSPRVLGSNCPGKRRRTSREQRKF